jgi:putative heme iron utilization protein
MTGCDSEGLDLRLGGETARLDFENLVKDASDARVELIRLVKQARSMPPNS